MLRINRARTLIFQPVLLAAVLVSFLPVAAHAGTITIDNRDGKAGTALVGSTGPFTLNSDLESINGVNHVGQVNFTTGSTFTGSLQTGGFWNFAGSTFTVKEQGMGTIFTGTFTTDISWILTNGNGAGGCTGTGGDCVYSLTGGVSGLYHGNQANGGTIQLYLTTTGGYYNGGNGHAYLTDTGGVTTLLTTVPEPGSMMLMGTGLLSLGFRVRQKLLSRGLKS